MARGLKCRASTTTKQHPTLGSAAAAANTTDSFLQAQGRVVPRCASGVGEPFWGHTGRNNLPQGSARAAAAPNGPAGRAAGGSRTAGQHAGAEENGHLMFG